MLRRKAAAVLAWPSRGTTERALDNVLETLPRDELLRLPVDELAALAEGVVDVGERRRVRLFVDAGRVRPLRVLPRVPAA